MSNIKKYKSFLESTDEKLWAGVQHEYSIYDWFEDLKRYEWMTDKENFRESRVIKGLESWTSHFIGDGWFNKISNHVDKIFDSLKKVNTEYINDRMYDVYDEVPDKEKWTMCCVLYGDVDRHNNTNRTKFNGLISTPTVSDVNKMRVIIHIIKEMVSPTLHIGGFKASKDLRMTKEERFVADKMYQCQNFNIKNFLICSEDDMGYEIRKKQNYNINLFLDMYQPGVVINIGGHNSELSTPFDLKDLESKIDETLPSILHDLDYKEVIFDHSRYTRHFSTEGFHEYTLKILLKI